MAPFQFTSSSSNQSASAILLDGQCCSCKSPFLGSATSLSSCRSPFGAWNANSVPRYSAFQFSSAPAFGASGTTSFGLPNTITSGFGQIPSFGSLEANSVSSNLGHGFSSAPAFGVSTSIDPSNTITSGSGQISSASSFGSSSLPGNTSFGTQNLLSGAQSTSHLRSINTGSSGFGGQNGGSRISSYAVTLEADQRSFTRSISGMPVYKDKSHEELRLEDYQLGDQGGCRPVHSDQFTTQTPGFSYMGTQWPYTLTPSQSLNSFIFTSNGGSRISSYTVTLEADQSSFPGYTFRLLSISGMPVYKDKSHEELKLEDYQLGDRGGCRPVHSNQFITQTPDFSYMGTQWPYTPTPSQSLNPFAFTSTNTFLPLAVAPTWNSAGVTQSGFRGEMGGSRIACYAATSEEDIKTGLFSAWKIVSASAMPIFSSKSHEVLRFEDYKLGDKGGYRLVNQFEGGLGISAPTLGSPFTLNAPCNTSLNSLFPSMSSNTFASQTPASCPSHRQSFGIDVATVSPNPVPWLTASSPSVQLFGFPGTEASIPAYTLPSGAPSSSNTFSTESSASERLPAACPNPFTFHPSIPPVPHVQLVGFPGTGASASAYVLPASGAPSSDNPFWTVSSASTRLSEPVPKPSIFLSPDPYGSAAFAPSSSFSFNGGAGASSAFISGFSCCNTQACPVFQSSTSLRGSLLLVPKAPSSLPNISRVASSECGFLQNHFSSIPSGTSNSAGFRKAKVSEKSASFRGGFSFGRRHSSLAQNGIQSQEYNSKSNCPKVTRFCNEEKGQTFKMDDPLISKDNPGPQDFHSTKDSPWNGKANESSGQESTSNSVNETALSDQTSHDKVVENLSVRPNFHANGVKYDNHSFQARCFRVTVKEDEDGEVVANVGQNPDITAIMPKIQSADYYTKPPIKELAARERAEPGFCGRVKNFVVGRQGYGSIKFLGEVDVRELDLESLIQFNHREVIVYMDESKKPPIGQGINRPAEVTLLNVKCIDKNTGKQYLDGPKVEKYQEMLKEKAAELGAEMVSHDPQEGEWKLKVQHL